MASIQFKDNGVLTIFEFDATLQETAELSSELTMHPLETGVSISDHQKHDNLELTLEVVVTNHPLIQTLKDGATVPVAFPRQSTVPAETKTITLEGRQVGTAEVLTQGSMQQLQIPFVPRRYTQWKFGLPKYQTETKTFPQQTNQYVGPDDRVKVIFERLVQLKSSGDLCTVIGKHHDFENMVLTEISAPTREEDSMTMTLTFTQLRFSATAEAVEGALTRLRASAEDRGTDKANAGKAASTEPETASPVLSRGESAGKALVNSGVVPGLPGVSP